VLRGVSLRERGAVRHGRGGLLGSRNQREDVAMDSGSSYASLVRGQVRQGVVAAVAAVLVIVLFISAVFALVAFGGGGTMLQAAFARPIITPYAAEGNVGSPLQLTAQDRQVVATVWVQCSPVGGDFRLRAYIVQGEASGDGYRVGHCSGTREDWTIRVPAKGDERFTEGSATACGFLAPIGSDARTRVEESYHWCSEVQLSRTP
jgi:hypothetical protein